MSRRPAKRQKSTARLPQGSSLDLFRRIASGGDRPGGTRVCPHCARALSAQLSDDGHAADCEILRRLNAPAGGDVEFERHSPDFPEAIGCDTCGLRLTCEEYAAHVVVLTRPTVGEDGTQTTVGEKYFNLGPDLRPGPGATNATQLMITNALVAEACVLWVERKAEA